MYKESIYEHCDKSGSDDAPNISHGSQEIWASGTGGIENKKMINAPQLQVGKYGNKYQKSKTRCERIPEK